MGRPKGGKNRRWTVEEKLRIVNRHLKDHISMEQVAREERVYLECHLLCKTQGKWEIKYILFTLNKALKGNSKK